MAQLRSVNTKFWEDPWVESLAPDEKLLFLYLITNSYANIAGIYEISMRRISFETGIELERVRKGLERLGKDKKAFFISGNYMFLPNFLKNQNLNANMKTGVLKIFNNLPKAVKTRLLGNDYPTILNDYRTLSNILLKYEILEVLEIKEILEEEHSSSSEIDEKENIYITSKKKRLKGKRLLMFEKFWECFDYKKGKSDAAQSWYEINELTDELCDKIFESAKKEAEARPALIRMGRTPKMAQGWLTSRRWEDSEFIIDEPVKKITTLTTIAKKHDEF